MIQRIGDDGILFAEERFEDAAVRIEAGRIENRILGAEVVGDGLFEFFVQVLAAADEPYGRHAESPCVHRPLGRFDEPRVIRKSQVVVGAEIQYFAACYLDFGALRRADDAFVFVETGGFDFGQFLLQIFLDFSVHGDVF